MKKYNLVIIALLLVFLSGCISTEKKNSEEKYQLEIVIGNYTNSTINGSIQLINENHLFEINESFFLGKLFEDDDGSSFKIEIYEGDYILTIKDCHGNYFEKEIHVYKIPTKYIYKVDENGITELRPAD